LLSLKNTKKLHPLKKIKKNPQALDLPGQTFTEYSSQRLYVGNATVPFNGMSENPLAA
jgi:hypothetical protein